MPRCWWLLRPYSTGGTCRNSSILLRLLVACGPLADALLHIFIACLFMIPTAFLIWFIARFETLFKAYSICCWVLALTCPLS